MQVHQKVSGSHSSPSSSLSTAIEPRIAQEPLRPGQEGWEWPNLFDVAYLQDPARNKPLAELMGIPRPQVWPEVKPAWEAGYGEGSYLNA